MTAMPEPSIWDKLAPLLVPDDSTAFWTMILAFATVALIVVAAKGLKSLKLAQKDMHTRAMRDARQTAISRAEEWAHEVIPNNAEILRTMAQNQVPVFVKDAAEVRFGPDNQSDLQRALTWQQKLPGGLFEKSVRMLNTAEAWAMYFTTGLADSKVAFGPCAPTFCSLIVQNYPLLLIMRASPGSGKYPNAVQLFRAWIDQLDEEKRGLIKGNLLKQLRALQAKGPAPPGLPDPLGTDIDKV